MKFNNSNYPIELGTGAIRLETKHYRPTEFELLVSDADLTKEKRCWSPRFNLDELLYEMVEANLQ